MKDDQPPPGRRDGPVRSGSSGACRFFSLSMRRVNAGHRCASGLGKRRWRHQGHRSSAESSGMRGSSELGADEEVTWPWSPGGVTSWRTGPHHRRSRHRVGRSLGGMSRSELSDLFDATCYLVAGLVAMVVVVRALVITGATFQGACWALALGCAVLAIGCKLTLVRPRAARGWQQAMLAGAPRSPRRGRDARRPRRTDRTASWGPFRGPPGGRPGMLVGRPPAPSTANRQSRVVGGRCLRERRCDSGSQVAVFSPAAQVRAITSRSVRSTLQSARSAAGSCHRRSGRLASTCARNAIHDSRL